MSAQTRTRSSKGSALDHPNDLLPALEALYKDIHFQPELAMHETRTASLAAGRLRAVGYGVTTGVGKTGVVRILRNGDRPTVLLRANMDVLSVQEETSLPYASDVNATNDAGGMVPVAPSACHRA